MKSCWRFRGGDGFRPSPSGAFGGFVLPTSLILFCHLFLRTAPQVAGQWARDLSTARRTRLVGAWMLIALLLATAVVYAARYRLNFNEDRADQLNVCRPPTGR